MGDEANREIEDRVALRHLVEQYAMAADRRDAALFADVFAEDGEDVFRQMESEVAREVARFKHHAIATGGGMILREENLRALEEAGMVVLLEASPEVIYERTCEDTNRPLLAGPDPRGAIDRLLAQRREAYHRVPIRIDTDGLELKEVADAILKHYHARESMTD